MLSLVIFSYDYALILFLFLMNKRRVMVPSNGMRCVSFCVLITRSYISFDYTFPVFLLLTIFSVLCLLHCKSKSDCKKEKKVNDTEAMLCEVQ